MSRNPAWKAFNEAAEKAKDEYDRAMKPLRAQAILETQKINAEFEAKAKKLEQEHTAAAAPIREAFEKKALEETVKRDKAITAARQILNAELKGQKAETAA